GEENEECVCSLMGVKCSSADEEPGEEGSSAVEALCFLIDLCILLLPKGHCNPPPLCVHTQPQHHTHTHTHTVSHTFSHTHTHTHTHTLSVTRAQAIRNYPLSEINPLIFLPFL